MGFPSRLSASATGHFAASAAAAAAAEVRYHVHTRRMMNSSSSSNRGNGSEVGFNEICMGKIFIIIIHYLFIFILALMSFWCLFLFNYCKIQHNSPKYRSFFCVFM